MYSLSLSVVVVAANVKEERSVGEKAARPRARRSEFEVGPTGVKGGRGERGWTSVGVRGVFGSAGLCFRGIPVTHHTFQLPSLELIDSFLGRHGNDKGFVCLFV